MTAEQLLDFLIHFQGETSSKASDVVEIMSRRHHIAFTRHALTPEDFQSYLFSDDLNSAIRNQVYHDMTAPLSNYFIYTGHNSYLTGNQLSSECSEVPIEKALKRGVRVIELDIWPNSSKDDVHVLRGRTLTSPVDKDLFEEDSWGKELPDTKLELPVDYKRAPQYKRLIVIHAKNSKGGLKESLKVDDVSVRSLSLSEQKLEKARAHHGTALVRFTQRNLLRVYPKGTRFNSSNYNPLIGWMHGDEMVAFNMQGYGRALWLMQGMFISNGDCVVL
ncbi:hypothetical protein IFM89_028941, partial [Coptis chinensis]